MNVLGVLEKGIELGDKILRLIERKTTSLISVHDVVVMKTALKNAKEIIQEKDEEIASFKEKESSWNKKEAVHIQTIKNVKDELDGYKKTKTKKGAKK